MKPQPTPTTGPKKTKPVTDNVMVTPNDILVSRYKGTPKERNTLKGEEHPEGKQPKVRVVEIHWVDAVAVGGDDWADEDDIHPEAAPSLAIGYVVNETDTTITVISLTNSSHFSHGITIPKGCIHKVVELK